MFCTYLISTYISIIIFHLSYSSIFLLLSFKEPLNFDFNLSEKQEVSRKFSCSDRFFWPKCVSR